MPARGGVVLGQDDTNLLAGTSWRAPPAVIGPRKPERASFGSVAFCLWKITVALACR